MSVFTLLREADIAPFLRNYEIGALIQVIPTAKGTDNTNYILRTSQDLFVLTCYEGNKDLDVLKKCLNFMCFLHKEGLSCPVVISSRTGEMIGNIAGKPATLQTFLKGEDLFSPNIHQCRQGGELLGELQLRAKDYPLGIMNRMMHATWRRLIEGAFPAAEDLEPGLYPFLMKELDHLEGGWPDDLPRGAVHCDFFPDNTKIKGNKLVGVFDFHYACHDFWAYDFALAFNSWVFDRQTCDFNPRKAEAFIEGYVSKRPFTKEERKALQMLARGAALRIVSTRLYDWFHVEERENIQKKDPKEYLARLKFHQKQDIFAELM